MRGACESVFFTSLPGVGNVSHMPNLPGVTLQTGSRPGLLSSFYLYGYIKSVLTNTDLLGS